MKSLALALHKVARPRAFSPLACLLGAGLTAWCWLGAASAIAFEGPYCGEEGVWVQTLGAGGPELDDGDAGPSYLLWINNRARLLIDPAPGASVRLDEAGADWVDLDAIALTSLEPDHAGGLPGLLAGGRLQDRSSPLAVLGPDGSADSGPGLKAFLERLIGPEGAWPMLADALSLRSGNTGIRVRPVRATGRKRWGGFASDNLRLAAIPVHRGGNPSLAWRVYAEDRTLVFTGDFSNQKDLVADFAEGADALIVSHALPEDARGDLRQRHVIPSQIGRIAERAGVRMVVLGHRTNRTRGRESHSRAAIETRYSGPILFSNDLECWGL